MTDKLREAAQMALDALIDAADSQSWEMQQNIEQHGEWYRRSVYLKQATAKSQEAIEALRAALVNEFNPDWDAMAVMVEVQQRMAKRIEELELALAQPEQEPPCKTGSQCVGNKCERCAVQPEREWVGLTDEERQECLYSDPIFGMAASTFARAIEAKLKEKNGG